MQRWTMRLMGLAMAVAMTGCIGVAASDNSRVVKGANDQIAVVGNDVYVINTKTGESKKVDLTAATAYVEPSESTVTASVTAESKE